MKNRIILTFLTLVLIGCVSYKKSNSQITKTSIKASIDLTKVVDDKLPIIINPGIITTEVATYRIPRIIQGTYSVSDFGRFIKDFKALDYNGKELIVTKPDINTWIINDAKNLDKITYLVNDTFDIENSNDSLIPLSPSGINIEPKNYVLNLHGLIGYFDSLKKAQYELSITSPIHFKHTSTLRSVNEKISDDGKNVTSKYIASRYFEITDNPMMFGDLDIEKFKVGKMNFELSVYSLNKLHTAKKIKKSLLQMLEAQVAYLGDINSSQNYTIMVYFSDGNEKSPHGYGGLEHNTSTVIVMPDYWEEKKLYNIMFDMMAHEFFHIVTPMTIHSEDIHDFDYNNPTFSKHLWLYEGVTEYFSKLFKVDQKLITTDEFYIALLDKIKDAKKYDDDISFTFMSENIIEEKYKVNYPNVYRKGALIAMCMDILMREESNGERSLLSLIKELNKKYGENTPFKDDNLIIDITEMTYPSIGNFLQSHVVGNTPINYQEYFDKVGLILKGDSLKEVKTSTQEQQFLRNKWLNKKESNITIIESVNVIPMYEEIILKNQDVVIVNDKIVSVHSSGSKKIDLEVDLRIDGTGKYLIPGLSEMHYHWRNNDRNIETDFKLLIANGITTARNMAEYDGQDHVMVRNKIHKGQLLGPNYYTTGPYLQADKLQTIEEAIKVIKQHKDKGYDFIKIGDGDGISKEVYLKVLEEASKYKLEVIGHAQHNLPLEYSLRMKSIEHVEEFIYVFNTPDNYKYLNNDKAFLNKKAKQIKASGVYIAPTLVIFEMITQYLDEAKFSKLKANIQAKYLPTKDSIYWLSDENHYRADFAGGKDNVGLGMDPLDFFYSYYKWMKTFTKILSDHDVPLLSGSDTFGMVIPGFSLHKEFEFLQEVGLTPYEILKTSTITPARYLNVMASEGTISDGKNANLVLLSKNPLEDIKNTKTIDGVMLKGKWFNRKKLDKLLLEVECSD